MIRTLAWALTLAGALPFLVATGLLYAFETAAIRVPAITALVTYAAVILSFLGGIEWGLCLREDPATEVDRVKALGWSVVPSLAAWGVLWLPSSILQVFGAILVLFATWAADALLTRRSIVPAWFFVVRSTITLIVGATLLAALLRL
jgi:hypothetical protein